jgi:ribonuclease P/MRP protein subunit RPP40
MTTHAVFYDFEKAFDLVIHLILLLKMDKLLPKWITTWIAKYLNNREQRVKTNNTVSEWIRVEAELIQDSVLGPILFLLFISDINTYLPPSTNLTKFCDDLLTYVQFSTSSHFFLKTDEIFILFL